VGRVGKRRERKGETGGGKSRQREEGREEETGEKERKTAVCS